MNPFFRIDCKMVVVVDVTLLKPSTLTDIPCHVANTAGACISEILYVGKEVRKRNVYVFAFLISTF